MGSPSGKDAVMGYAMHIGRVGALAVALGIGIAVANTPGTARADDASTDSSDSTDNVGPSDSPNETTSTHTDSGAVAGAEDSSPGAAAISPAPPLWSRQSRPRVIFGSGRGPRASSPSSGEPTSGGNDTAAPAVEADGKQPVAEPAPVAGSSRTANLRRRSALRWRRRLQDRGP